MKNYSSSEEIVWGLQEASDVNGGGRQVNMALSQAADEKNASYMLKSRRKVAFREKKAVLLTFSSRNAQSRCNYTNDRANKLHKCTFSAQQKGNNTLELINANKKQVIRSMK